MAHTAILFLAKGQEKEVKKLTKLIILTLLRIFWVHCTIKNKLKAHTNQKDMALTKNNHNTSIHKNMKKRQ